MTAELTKTPREAIAELVHRYADAVISRDQEQWTSTWAEDATWTLGPGRDVAGRDAIVALWISAMSKYRAVVQTVQNGEVRFDGGGTDGNADTASGRWHITEHTCRVDDVRGMLLAHYDDTYVRVAGEWKFASRRLTAHYAGPVDLSGPFLNATP